MREVIASLIPTLFRISVKMRDGFDVPLVMTYDKNFFNEKSPWIMFTEGAQSQKSDLQFDISKLSLLNRGLCLCYPLIRGKKITTPHL